MSYLEEKISSHEFICTNEKHNVFLIGDSIREGYCSVVKEHLSDIANVFYTEENNRNTQYVITQLREYHSKFNSPELIDIVHFNCGHWDIAHWNGGAFSLTSISEYARNLELIISLIKVLFVNAVIVFATTSPMNPSGEMGVNCRTNKEIDEYNLVARNLCKKNNIPINDINEYVKDWDAECYKDYAHLTKSANNVLGKKVSERLRDVLLDMRLLNE